MLSLFPSPEPTPRRRARRPKQAPNGLAITYRPLWTLAHVKNETGHSTQKPIECMKRPIENNSRPGDAVYEPFSGSGTTIIAAEMTGRACHAIEIEPRYVDVAVRRWQAFTGSAATLEATGQSFAEVEHARS